MVGSGGGEGFPDERLDYVMLPLSGDWMAALHDGSWVLFFFFCSCLHRPKRSVMWVTAFQDARYHMDSRGGGKFLPFIFLVCAMMSKHE